MAPSKYKHLKTRPVLRAATSSFDPLVANNNERNYGPQSTDCRIVGTINYSYDLPKPGQLLHSRALGAITDNWSISAPFRM